jgi:hypothetical protein
VLNENDWGLADCRLDFYAETGAWQGYTYSSDGGEFSMVLASGNYNMIVTAAKGYFADSAYYAVSVPGSDVRVVARQGVRVYGTVSASDGHPLGGVTIQLLPQITIQQSSTRLAAGKPVASLVSYLAGSDDDPVVDSGLIYEPYPMPLERGANVTRSDYDGNWELIVKPGVYDVYATPSLYGYVNSFLPSVDCTSERRVNLVIEQGEIVFEGLVKDADGREVPGTLVSLFDPENGGQISVFTDATGRFRLDVPMGEYEMFIEGPNGSGELPTSDRLQLDSDRQVLIQLGHGLLDSDNPGPSLPRAFALGQNVPNPFNPSTTISYALDEQARVKLAVYDVRGRTVAILVDKVQDEGDYDIQWDGKDTNGRRLASGIYIYRLQAGSHQQTRKMVLIK